MNDFLANFGVEPGTDLGSHDTGVTYPTEVPGRVAHIDADFLAYMVSAESKDETEGLVPRRSFEDMQNNARSATDHLRRLAGASDFRCHITPSASTKGGRAGQAVQQEYQANRSGRDKPEFLDAVRAFLGQELNGVVHLDQEADDGLAQANYGSRGSDGSWGDSNLSVIISKDKDLRMVPGLHMDWVTGEMHCTGNPFGSIYIDESTSSKKLSGWGTKFFWAQCLMGDTADNIKGVPLISGVDKLKVAPTQAYNKLRTQHSKAKDDAARDKYLAKIKEMAAKPVTCGPVMAHSLLKDCQTDRECFEVVKGCFERLSTYSGYRFFHWQTEKPVTPTQALLGDMLLLWMRRNKNPNDVIDWIKEIVT